MTGQPEPRPRPNRALRVKMRLLESNWPGWHVWLDSGGRLNATTANGPYGGNGMTLDAPDTIGLNRAIADAEVARAIARMRVA